jgi:hypothetical protein
MTGWDNEVVTQEEIGVTLRAGDINVHKMTYRMSNASRSRYSELLNPLVQSDEDPEESGHLYKVHSNGGNAMTINRDRYVAMG